VKFWAVVAAVVVAMSTLVSPANAGTDPESADCTPTLDEPVEAPALADSTWPTEHADAWRTHAVAAGPKVAKGTELSAKSATLPPAPAWGYSQSGDTIYVVGGAPYLLDMFTKVILGAPEKTIPLLVAQSKQASTEVTPYVARIDRRSMKVDVLELPDGTSVNYVGGVLVHANGSVYAVARSVLYKIDPATFTITASAMLPLLPDDKGTDNEATAYNGMVATQDGDLILKGWASTGGGDAAPGYLLRVDPDTLTITGQLTTDVITSARMAIVEDAGTEYVYMPGKTQSLRFVVQPDAFVLDEAFSQQTYLEPDSKATQASSDVYLGAGVVFTDNTVPTAETPMQLFVQPSTGPTPSPALTKEQIFSSDDPSWNFFMAAADPYRSGIVVLGDQVSGHVAGYRVCAGNASVHKLWENSSLQASAGVAIDYGRGVLYTDDRSCRPKQGCKLFLVALDLSTGTELTRVRVQGTKPSIGQIFIVDDAVYYPATDTGEAHGYVTRVTAR
jgi:hypothetical protein